ncbi:hypothetical protein LINPERPRIM_LOCUS24279 [Linum perenne]
MLVVIFFGVVTRLEFQIVT